MQTRTETEATGLALELEPEPIKAPAIVPTTEEPRLDTETLAGRPPLDQVRDLLRSGVTIEQLREFLVLQREWEAEEARRAYHAAMAAFKREDLPEIVKRIHVAYPVKDRQTGAITGNMDYRHEELADVVAAVLEPMAKHGLTHKWSLGQDRASGMVTVRCVVTHERGHSDSEELFAMPDESGRKNAIQAVKSTISYLERITLLAIAGLAARGMDDDGRSSGAPREEEPPRIKPRTEPPRATPQTASQDPGEPPGKPPSFATSKQVGLIKARLIDANIPVDQLLDALVIDTLEELAKVDVDHVLAWIKGGGVGRPGGR